MQTDFNAKKFMEIISALFTEKMEIAEEVNGKRRVLGYTIPKTIVVNEYVKVMEIPRNSLAFIVEVNGKKVLRLVQIEPPELAEKLLHGEGN